MNQQANKIIQELVDALGEARRGYMAASRDASRSHLKRILKEYADQRAAFAESLMGSAETSDGSLNQQSMPTGVTDSHHGWTNLRAVRATRSDLAILEECERAEGVAESLYRDALAANVLNGTQSTVSDQYVKIRAAHEHLRALRDSVRQLS